MPRRQEEPSCPSLTSDGQKVSAILNVGILLGGLGLRGLTGGLRLCCEFVDYETGRYKQNQGKAVYEFLFHCAETLIVKQIAAA